MRSVLEFIQQGIPWVATAGLCLCPAIILFVGLRKLFISCFRQGPSIGFALLLLIVIATRVGGSKTSTPDGEDEPSYISILSEDIDGLDDESITGDGLWICGFEVLTNGVLVSISGSGTERYEDETVRIEGNGFLATNGWATLLAVPYEAGDGIVDVFIPYTAIQSDDIPDAFFLRLYGEALEGDLSLDSDGDGLPDVQELEFGSDPLLADSDGDGMDDLTEWRIGGDPNVTETLADMQLGFEPALPSTPVTGDSEWSSPDTSGGDVVGSHTVSISFGSDTSSAGLSVFGVGWPGGTATVSDLSASVPDADTDGVFSVSAGGASFVPRETGSYSFQLAVDDRATLSIGNELTVTGSWSSGNLEGLSPVGSAILVEGESYPISLQWWNYGGPGSLSFPVWGVYSPIERPTLGAGFSARRVLCSQSVRAAKPKRRIRSNELTDFSITVTGGALGGTVNVFLQNAACIAHVAKEEIPVSFSVAPFETREIKGVYRGVRPTSPGNDVQLSVQFVEARTGRELRQSAPLTVEAPQLTSLSVKKIRFDHTPNDAYADAAALRRNSASPFDLSNGEWYAPKGTCLPMCYLSGSRVTVKASLDLGISIDTNLTISAETASFAFRNLKAKSVTFTDGRSGLVEFEAASNVKECVESGTGSINWQVVDSSVSATTGPHKYYIVFDNPLEPWSTLSGSDQNLWTDALDIACSAANGDADPCAALAHLTSALFNYGYTYDCMSGDSHFYSGSANILSLGAYIGQSGSMLVNCYDQAYVLSSLGRALGVESEVILKQPMGYISTNTLVGGLLSNNPFYWNTTAYCSNPICSMNDHISTVERSPFGRHLYVVFQGKVYDACVGPFLGDYSEQEYFSSVIESSANLNLPIEHYPRSTNYDLR